jgi:phosphoserine aminotransferase
MNACFRIEDPAIEKEFLQECKSHGMVGVKGHRSSGGFRISLYNALPIDSVIAITDLMKDFSSRKG